jgi:DNA-binding CsgD family transcriptional regulator
VGVGDEVLWERERELAELDALLGRAGAGEGCAVAIEAGAGLGKTHLLHEARKAGATAELDVLSARATDLERDFPFSLVRQLFESRLAILPPDEREKIFEGASAARGALGGDPNDTWTHDSFSVLHGLYWVTAALAEKGPLLLAIDDLHLADAASLDYLCFLLPRLEELSVVLVMAARPDEPDSAAGLEQVLTDSSVRHLKLTPLSAEGSAALLAQELERQPEPLFAATCHEVSGGNPFLLCELARTLLEQSIEPMATQGEVVRKLAPERVGRMALTRIAQLSSEAAVVARSLAVLGDDADPRLLAEFAGLELEATQRASDELRAGAILDAAPSPRFVHPLVRNAIYADLPVGERVSAHSRAATLLRDRNASPEQIATQLLASEPQGERATVETLLLAGERALLTGAPRSAIAYLTRALHEPPPAELRPVVLGPLMTAGFRAADHSVLAGIDADVLAEWKRNPALRSRWAVPLTLSMALAGRFEEALSILREAIEVAVAEDDVDRAFQLEAQLSTIALLVPSAPKVDLSRYAGKIDPDSPTGRLAAAMEVRSAVVNGTAKEATDAARRALGNEGVIFAEEPELVASTVAVMTLVAADEIDAAREAAERALETARQRDAVPDLARGWFLNGFVAWGAGDLVAAEADMRQAIDLMRMAGIVPAVLTYTGPLMEILIERDELQGAEEELRSTGMSTGPIPETAMFGSLLLMRGHLRYEKGEFEAAIEDCLAISAMAEKVGFGSGPALSAAPFAARALVAVGKQEQAVELVEGMMDIAQRWGTPATVAHILRAVAVARGGAEGIKMFEEAAAMLTDSPRRIERAHALADLGEALRRGGRRSDARAPLREAVKLARQCGAARIARRAHGDLQASGETVRRYTPIGVESLTPSERRVAEMAATGMSNRQIAQSLFVTVKTVEAHLSAAYDKLDIDGRRHLAAALEGSTETGH